METAITAIITGLFMLLGVWLKDYLEHRRKSMHQKPAHTTTRHSPTPATARRSGAENTADAPRATDPMSPLPYGSSNSNKLLYYLTSIQLVIVIAAVIAQWVAIESILGFGPALSLFGLLIAWQSKKRRLWFGIPIGLSAVGIRSVLLDSHRGKPVGAN